MRTQKRLEKISTAISLLGLALGFSVLGLMIVAKEHDGGASITGGILGILLGAAFLIAACLHWKCCDQIQGGFQVEEVPAAEIVSEMRRAAEAICCNAWVSVSRSRIISAWWSRLKPASKRRA